MLRAFSLITALTLLSQTAWAFDASAFQRQDAQSVTAAEQFLALPAAQRQQLALEYMGNDQATAPTWQVFLLAYLSSQPQNANDWELIQAAENDRPHLDSSVMLPAEQAANQQLCFLQLQQPYDPELDKEDDEQLSDQRDKRASLDTVCIAQVLDVAQQPEVFAWLLARLNAENHPQRQAIFDYSVTVDKFDPAQTQQLRKTLAAQYFDKDDNDTYGISTFLGNSADEALLNPFVSDLQEGLAKATEEQIPRILETLVALDSTDAAQAFWNTVWDNPARYFRIAHETLMAEYSDQDELFPEALHTAALKHLDEQSDVRFMASYLFLLVNAEGGDWRHVRETVEKLEAISEKAPDDPETQAVLKYVYLQAAGARYLDDEERSLGDTLKWLDKAKTITAEPLSWYLHASNGSMDWEEERPDQRSTFAPVKALHADGQLAALVAWHDNQQKPEKPFTDLPAEIYSVFTDSTVVARPWHDAATGAALLLDNAGELSYFDGYEQNTAAMPFSAQPIDNSVEKPTVRSPLAIWFEYIFQILTANQDGPVTLASLDEALQRADQRLLFSPSDNWGNGDSRYLEYVRYGSQVMLNAEVKGEVHSYWLRFPAATDTTRWLTQLQQPSATGLKAQPLWHWVNDEKPQVLARHYRHFSTEDELILSPLYADSEFRYTELDCSREVKPAALEQQAAAFAQAEYALFQQGYMLSKIIADSACVE